MHPCIEDFGKLQDINEKYQGLSGKDKGLHMSNITAIQRTEKILTLYWADKAKTFFEKNDDSKEKHQVKKQINAMWEIAEYQRLFV